MMMKLRGRGITPDLQSGTHKVIEKLSHEKVSQQEALEKFKWKVVRDHEIKVLGEVNVELESDSKKLKEKLSQEEDTKEEAFEEFSATLDNVLVAQNNVHEEVAEEVIEMANDQAEALSSDKEVTDECLDDEHVEERRPSKRIRTNHSGFVVAQNNVHKEVAKEVIEMANDQVEALSSDKEVTDECLDDEHVEEENTNKG
ncbi:hypothetical protein Tco_0742438 [Tanacetum coccineum]